jgi:serine/threonine-protein kinase RsbW
MDGQRAPNWAQDGITVLVDALVDRQSWPQIRRRVGEVGAAAGLADVALMKFVLVVHELVTNALRHAGGQAVLRIWAQQDQLWCTVSDRGPGMPAPFLAGQRYRPGADIGTWGLWLVRQICPDVLITSGPDGTEVLISYPTP